MLNFKTLFEYRKRFNLFSYAFLKRLGYRISHPNYFINLLWILRNSTPSLDDYLQMFVESDPNKVRKYLDEAIVNVLGHDDYHYLLYTTVRILKPSIVVETGVNEGYSTQAILSAMDLNNFGKLYSIDLPNVSNAPDLRSYNLNSKEVGYIVPTHLRNRWELRIGDAKILLSPLLSELGEIDIFLHDSLHTYDHMLYEYREAWYHIKVNGLLISHDIQMNSAFKNFVPKNYRNIYILHYNIGIVLKND